MSYSIGHTLVTPLEDGRVSYTPCRRCGDPCRGHSMAGRLEVASHCRTCGAECAPAQCDACRADGEAARAEERAVQPVELARHHLVTLADLANRAVANPPHHAEDVEALDAAQRALAHTVEAGEPQP